MVKLSRYLRPYVVFMVTIIVLLFVQALANLTLPDYMSRIVNIGIQQSGVRDPIPTVLRATSLDQLLDLLPDAARSDVASAYQRLDVSELTEQERQAVIDRYPLAEQEVLFEKRTDLAWSDPALASFKQALAHWVSGPQAGAGPSMDQDRPADQAIINRLLLEYRTIGLDLTGLQRQTILTTGGFMLLIALVGALAAVFVGFFSARLAAGVARDLRLDVFTHIESFSSAEFDRFSTASLITRTTNDIQQVQTAIVMLMRMLIFAPIMGIGGIIKAVQTNTSMIWIVVVVVSILLLLVTLLYFLAVPRFKRVQKLVDRLNLVTREFLSGLLVIRAFNTQAHEEARFEAANQDLTRVSLFVNRLMAAAMPVMTLLMNVTGIFVVWVGSRQVDLGHMQVGDIMAFIQYTMQIIMSFLMVSAVFILLPRAGVSAQRIVEVLDMPLTIQDPDQPQAFVENQRGRVVFDQVSFAYPDAVEPVLCDVSFTAEPGQTTAIIGSTGCGKSTLVNLIPRFYDVTRGRILVNGVDVRAVSQKSLRDRIGYVPQQGILFSGSVRDNITYGQPQAQETAVWQAARTAQAEGFISEDSQGLDRPVAQGGTNVSGGQKQRLAIARALIKKPDLFIFDDSFSALDYQTDARLRMALKQDLNPVTVIIVAQRIATIRQAHQILVLDQGRIVGRGKHDELIKTCRVYREIAASQLPEEEWPA